MRIGLFGAAVCEWSHGEVGYQRDHQPGWRSADCRRDELSATCTGNMREAFVPLLRSSSRSHLVKKIRETSAPDSRGEEEVQLANLTTIIRIGIWERSARRDCLPRTFVKITIYRLADLQGWCPSKYTRPR